MIDVCNSSSPIRLRRMLVHPASGWLVVLLLWPVGLAGQETQQVTLYTPDGSQQRTLSTPLVVDVGLPSPMEAPVSAVVGTGTGTRVTDVEVVVSDSAGGQTTVSYADGWITTKAADESKTMCGWERRRVRAGSTAGSGRPLPKRTAWRTARSTRWRWTVRGMCWPGAGMGRGFLASTVSDGPATCLKDYGETRVAIAPNGDVWCSGYDDVLLARFDGQDWWAYKSTPTWASSIVTLGEPTTTPI